MATDPPHSSLAATVAGSLDATLVRDLGGRQRHNWLICLNDQLVVLREHRNPMDLSPEDQRDSIAWERNAQQLLRADGWPTPQPIRDPWWADQRWWTLETVAAGQPRPLTTTEHAHLWSTWQQIGTLPELGPRPHAWEPLACLHDPTTPQLLAQCADPPVRALLLQRWHQTQELHAAIDWSSAVTTLVHGDLTSWNIHWSSGQLTGILDLELTHHGRRTTEAINIWRGRHDNILWALHHRSPWTNQEWRMILVEWWSSLLTLATHDLARHRPRDPWVITGLQRRTPLITHIRFHTGHMHGD